MLYQINLLVGERNLKFGNVKIEPSDIGQYVDDLLSGKRRMISAEGGMLFRCGPDFQIDAVVVERMPPEVPAKKPSLDNMIDPSAFEGAAKG